MITNEGEGLLIYLGRYIFTNGHGLRDIPLH